MTIDTLSAKIQLRRGPRLSGLRLIRFCLLEKLVLRMIPGYLSLVMGPHLGLILSISFIRGHR